jgi:hypothetical protein
MKHIPLPNRRLRLASPALFALERLFALFSRLSLADRLFDTRESYHLASSSVQRVRITIRRSRAIDFYLLVWITTEIVCAAVAVNGWLYPLVSAIVSYRIFEILQAQFNINLFSPLRHPNSSPRVASTTRMVTNSLLNYIEMALCFGVIYTTAGTKSLVRAEYWFDPFFFSVMSQLTGSYGDLNPLGWVRPVATFQGLAGFIIAVLVIGRLAGLLPRVREVMRTNR